MKKLLSLCLVLVGILTMLVGCGKEAEETESSTDDVTTASIKVDAAGIKEAMSADGAWIIIALNDITSDEDLVLEGEFRNKDDETKDLYRKIALYTQDADHNVIDRFTLTAPSLTIKSPNARIQGGTFKGDVYVEANGFNVKDAKIDGNVYFASEEYKASFDASAGEVTGDISLVEAATDDVTTASIKVDAAGIKEAMSADGAWIIIALNDITSDEDLVLDGEFRNKDDATKDLYRKIALYTQDADHNVTERFTLTAPSLTIKSPNARIQGGTFKGDVYVEANGFNVKDAKIDGNVYFTNEEYKSSFDASAGEVTGTTEVK